MSEAPSFPFYANDFVGGKVATYDLAEIGAYSLLLAFDWTLNGLPTETERLAKLCRVSHRKFQKIWSTIADQFPETEGRRYNKRLQLERAKKGIKSVNASNAAAQRWHSGGNASASILHHENDASITNTKPLLQEQLLLSPDAREMSDAAIALVAAANKGLAEHPDRPQRVPRILPGQGATVTAVTAISRAGVPLAFAQSQIYQLATTHTSDRGVHSLGYFTAATIQAWQKHLAGAAASELAVSAPPAGAPGATSPPQNGTRTNGHHTSHRARPGVGGGARNDAAIDAAAEQLREKYGER